MDRESVFVSDANGRSRNFVEEGRALERKRTPPSPRILDDEAEVRGVASYQGRRGTTNWSLRLLACGGNGIVESRETVRRTLKNGLCCKRKHWVIPPEGGVRSAPSA